LRCPENEAFPLNIAKLYTTAIEIINLVSSIDTTTQNFATYIPHHVYRMMTLAAAVVLRVLKTTLSDKLQETDSGKAAFFTAIALLRKMSVYNNDMPSRMQGIFSQLWESEKAFKPNERSGSSTALRIQSRLSMSLLHDTMWWWREEFGGVQDVKPKQSTKGIFPSKILIILTSPKKSVNMLTNLRLSQPTDPLQTTFCKCKSAQPTQRSNPTSSK
jgi:hypothetical protein